MSMSHDEMIAVIQAHKEGKEIQIEFNSYHGQTGWRDCASVMEGGPIWDFGSFIYRIKPEPPKPREWWIGFCAEHGPHEKIFGERPIPQCPHCDIVHVREVLP